MRSVRISGTTIETSRLGLGSSSLHHLPTERARQALLEHAWNAGIRYFDAAPLYGHGLAERALGKFARNRRSEMTLVTKFGILPTPWLASIPALAFPLIGTRAALARLGLIGPPTRDYSAAQLRNSVECSLANLRTDCIDVLMLHEPELALISNPDELAQTLKELQTAGKVRHIGISGGGQAALAIGIRQPSLAEVIQLDMNEATGGIESLRQVGRDVQISFGHLRVGSAQGIEAKWQAAVHANPSGVILFSSTRTAHIDQIAALTRRFDTESGVSVL